MHGRKIILLVRMRSNNTCCTFAFLLKSNWCSICLNIYTDPKQLQCHHVPTCRHVTPLLDSRVSGLQAAFHVNNLLEIKDLGVGGPTATKDEVQYCLEHAEEKLKLCCGTCGELVCYHCVIKGGKHHDHEYTLLKEAVEKYRLEISPSLEPLEKEVISLEEDMAKLDALCVKISCQTAANEDQIHNSFSQLREALNGREAELTD